MDSCFSKSSSEYSGPSLVLAERNGEMEEADRKEQLKRSTCVVLAALADTGLNYPPWLVAKRLGAGLPGVPPNWNLYVGGGTLLLSTGPTWITQEFVSSAGVVGGALCASPVEYIITKASKENVRIGESIRRIHRTSPLGFLFPPGRIAVVCREAPCCTCLFFLQGFLERKLIEAEKGFRGGHDLAKNEVQLRHTVLSGILSGVIATSISQPFSVLAARMQADDIRSLKDAFAVARSPGGGGVWNGLRMRMLALCGTLTVMPITMRWTMDTLF